MIVRLPSRRRAVVVGRNVSRYLFKGAVRSWFRNLGVTAPALGSMTLLLLLAGLGDVPAQQIIQHAQVAVFPSLVRQFHVGGIQVAPSRGCLHQLSRPLVAAPGEGLEW